MHIGRVLRFLQDQDEARMECFRGPNEDMLRSARPNRGPLVEFGELVWPRLATLRPDDVLADGLGGAQQPSPKSVRYKIGTMSRMQPVHRKVLMQCL